MRITTFFLGFLMVVTALIVCSCGSAKCPAKSALVRQVAKSSEKKQITITDHKTLSKLLGFFGDIGNEEFTDVKGKWKEKYRISFIMKSGMYIMIITSEDDATWTSGSGDKQMKPGLSAFLDPMFPASAAASDSSGDSEAVAEKEVADTKAAE